MSAAVEVVAPSRLHFGMFSFGHSGQQQFGGAGLMIDRPGLRLRVTPAQSFVAAGPLTDRVTKVAEHLARAKQMTSLPACRMEVLSAPPQHVGLGTGTQLALAVTAGVSALAGNWPLDAEQLARLSGRGARSAVGTHGFLHGGFIVESGKMPDQSLSPLEHHVALPDAWRYVVAYPHGTHGLAGEDEQIAFRDLPPVPAATTQLLRQEVDQELLPAAVAGDFGRFSQSVYRFGRQAGECFAARQFGAFASPAVAELVETIRRLGTVGVGQSSWGPAVFAVLPSQDAADHLVEQLRSAVGDGYSLLIAKASPRGATVDRQE